MLMITALKFTTAWQASIAALIFAACIAQAADGRLSFDDLAMRANGGDIGAMRTLAEAHYAGRDGISQDFAISAEWYRRLARTGDARAQTSLGLMYARGYGVDENMAVAHRWWNFAAAQNDPGAQYNLGLTYAQGEGVAVDPVRAARWFREAAMRGHIQAQHNIGLLLHEGRGVARNPQEAYYWLKIAATHGNENSRRALPLAAATLTDAELNAMNERAAAWINQAK